MGIRLQPPVTQESFTSSLHDTRTTAWLGLALAVTFSVCFVTGLLSHLIQHPPGWFEWPPRPGGLYRVTQGLHVATGIISVPLLLAKLWVVYPHLWTWPPVRSAAHAVERISLLPLVGGSLFMLFSGVANIARWYPWPFNFTRTHYWVAWITIGALVVHVGAKAGATRDGLRRRSAEGQAGAGSDTSLSRRGFLGATAGAAGLLTVATVGQTFRPFDTISVLAPRRPNVGPQGLPVNKSAAGARVIEAALDPSWRLDVEGAVATPLSLSLEDLASLPQYDARLVITCVEGWSASGRWRGVRVRELLDMAGARRGATAVVHSLQKGRFYTSSTLSSRYIEDDDTLLALALNDEPLHIDHGYPLRLIAPNRPGVLQTKWLSRVVVL